MTGTTRRLAFESFPQPADGHQSTGASALDEIIVRLVHSPSMAAAPAAGDSVPTTLLVWQRLKATGWNRR